MTDRVERGPLKRMRLPRRMRKVPSRRRHSDAFNLILLELVLSRIVLGEPALELRAQLDELVRKQAPDPDEVPDGYIEHVYLGQRSE